MRNIRKLYILNSVLQVVDKYKMKKKIYKLKFDIYLIVLYERIHI